MIDVELGIIYMWWLYSRNVEYVYVLCMNPWMLYLFVLNYDDVKLTPSGRLVDHLPIYMNG